MAEAGAAPAEAPARLRSLDIFRGATVAMMILVNNPGSWNHLYPPLAHAAWHGMTPTDLVFPWFLLAVGFSLALVMQRPGVPVAAFWARVARRTVLIFAIGLALNASPLWRWDAAGELVLRSWDNLRWMGVLQRIALCFGAAALIVALVGRRSRGVLVACAALLLGYWAACLWWGRAGDAFSLEGFFGTALDRAWLGAAHLYRGEGVPFDPEGLASTVPAVAQVLLGWCVGDWLARERNARASSAQLALQLWRWALWLGVLAYLWQLAMPLNKKLWTSSYVLASTALALAALAMLVQRFDAGNDGAGRAPNAAPAWHGGATPHTPAASPAWARFFEVFGQNALFVFVLSGLVPRFLSLLRWDKGGVGFEGRAEWTSPLPWAYETLFAPLTPWDARAGSLLFALAHLALYWALAAALARQRIFIRL